MSFRPRLCVILCVLCVFFVFLRLVCSCFVGKRQKNVLAPFFFSNERAICNVIKIDSLQYSLVGAKLCLPRFCFGHGRINY